MEHARVSRLWRAWRRNSASFVWKQSISRGKPSEWNKKKPPALFCWSRSSRSHPCTLVLPGSLSTPSAAPATGRERHIWVKRAREDAKGEIKNAVLPQKKLGSYRNFLILLPHVCLEIPLQAPKWRDTPPQPTKQCTLLIPKRNPHKRAELADPWPPWTDSRRFHPSLCSLLLSGRLFLPTNKLATRLSCHSSHFASPWSNTMVSQIMPICKICK